MPNPHRQAVKSAVKANDEVGRLLKRLGSNDNPRGIVYAAYRNAHRALKSALQERQKEVAVREVLTGLRSSLRNDLRTVYRAGQTFGVQESARQLSYYDIQGIEPNSMQLVSQTDSAIDAVLARVDAQTAAINALLVTGADEDLITGRDDRAGILRPGEVLLIAAFWLSTLIWDAFEFNLFSARSGKDFQKQAVAALDMRTTQCCLLVHGQIQPFNSSFDLRGEPRYADRIDFPPFHGYCRTSVALYLPEFEDGLTDVMRNEAAYLIDLRASVRQ